MGPLVFTANKLRFFILFVYITCCSFLCATGQNTATVTVPECDPSWQNTIRNKRITPASDFDEDRRFFYLHHHQYHNNNHNNGNNNNENKDTLRLVHVLFRHGERTADPDAQYPKDPYKNETYYPYGYGQLTNHGKKREYEIGVALRNRYNYFLGDIYLPEILDARSTDVNRTKASLELALAGLFPPVKEQIWSDMIYWQPIPYNYWRSNEDTILGDPIVACPQYKKIYDKNLLTEANVDYNEKNRQFYEYVSYHTGLNITEPMDIFNIYFTFKAEEEWGFKLPEWTDCIWPDKFLEVAIKQYELYTQTPELTGLSAGMLLQKIINESVLIRNGTLTPEGRKMFIYSGHERNVALMLIALGLFEHPHIPPYGSYVLIELHEINGVYGFKIYYQDYSKSEPQLQIVPGCEAFCPLDQFYSILSNNLPKSSCEM